MNQEVKIGKYTLESLTTGMYEDPMVIFREYLQNAVDSIDQAVERKIMRFDQNRIDINLTNNGVSIKDNGIGIKKDLCRLTLLDVGNSQKRYHKHRGFRGIGRLVGLIFCENLTFYTSYQGEPYKSAVQFNCDRLKDLLVPGMFEAYDIIDILLNVSSFSVIEEDIDAHYLEVRLDTIDPNHSSLISDEAVLKYLSQVAPVPFNQEKFTAYKQLDQILQNENLKIDEYNIYLNDQQVFKPYEDTFSVGTGSNKSKVDIEKIRYYKNDKLDYFVWYPEYNMKGIIERPDLRGLRLRKGNILIGNEQSLELLFNESAQFYYKWIMGEIHVNNQKLIPNAHRNNFETVNRIYYDFIESLRPLAQAIEQKAKDDFSRSKINKEIDRYKEGIETYKLKTSDGISLKAEEICLLEDLEMNKKKLDRIKTIDQNINEQIKLLNQEIDHFLEKLHNNNYDEPEKLKKMKREQRKIVRIVLEILSNELAEDKYSIVSEKILAYLNGKRKQRK